MLPFLLWQMTQEHICCPNVLTLPQQRVPSVTPTLNLGYLCDGLKEWNAAGHPATPLAGLEEAGTAANHTCNTGSGSGSLRSLGKATM